MQSKIPKIFMQTWKNKIVPNHWLASQKSIKKQMPDYEYILMTDRMIEKFVAKHFPDFLPYLLKFPYKIQWADAIRYCFLYVYGGVYMDLDFELKDSLEELFQDGKSLYLIKYGEIKDYVTNCIMAAAPGQPIFLEMIEEMKKKVPWYAIGKHLTVYFSTGPTVLTRVRNKMINDLDIGYMPKSLVMPCTVCDDYKLCSKGALVNHLKGESWNEWDSEFFNFILCNYQKLVVLFFLIIIIILISMLIIQN